MAAADTEYEKQKRRNRTKRDYEREKFERLHDNRILVNRTFFSACDRSRPLYVLSVRLHLPLVLYERHINKVKIFVKKINPIAHAECNTNTKTTTFQYKLNKFVTLHAKRNEFCKKTF